MTIKKTAPWRRRVTAFAGALAIALTGVVGASTAATATVGPGQPGSPDNGTLTIHKYAGNDSGVAGDGTVLTPAPDLPALAGVQFTVQRVNAISGVDVSDLTEAEAWDVIADLGNTTWPAASDLTLAAGQVVTTGANGVTPALTLPIGLYYVTETDAGPNDIVSPADPFLVAIPLPQGDAGWLYDVHVYPKNTVENEATKTVDDEDAYAIGDAVTWTVVTPSLSVQSGNSLGEFSVTDDLVDQLEFVANSVSAAVIQGSTSDDISASDFANYFTVGYTPSGPGGTLTISATTAGLAYLNTLPTSAKLSFSFDTTVVGVGEIVNTADVNIGGTETTTSPATTNWGPALITKVDAASGDALQGAEFSVYVAGPDGVRPGDDALPIIEGVETNAAGEIVIDGLKVGTYWLLETAAPAGYVLPEGDDAWFGPIVVAAGTDVAATAAIEVPNAQQSVPTLPLTGANGQLLMMLGGIALVLVAGGGALAVRNRSKSAE